MFKTGLCPEGTVCQLISNEKNNESPVKMAEMFWK